MLRNKKTAAAAVASTTEEVEVPALWLKHLESAEEARRTGVEKKYISGVMND